jgi:hypothetical protein
LIAGTIVAYYAAPEIAELAASAAVGVVVVVAFVVAATAFVAAAVVDSASEHGSCFAEKLKKRNDQECQSCSYAVSKKKEEKSGSTWYIFEH